MLSYSNCFKINWIYYLNKAWMHSIDSCFPSERTFCTLHLQIQLLINSRAGKQLNWELRYRKRNTEQNSGDNKKKKETSWERRNKPRRVRGMEAETEQRISTAFFHSLLNNWRAGCVALACEPCYLPPRSSYPLAELLNTHKVSDQWEACWCYPLHLLFTRTHAPGATTLALSE